MPELQINQSRLDRLAEDFAERYRRGERPAISEYVRENPDLAEQIEDLFPALAMMEQVDHDLPHRANLLETTRSAEPSLTKLGDFRIIREVGRGGMGVVYEAEQVSLGRRVALKLLPRQALLDSRHQKRFLREAKAAARLHHTNIVPVFGVGQQDGLHYYVMQFIHGLGLDEVLVELQRLRVEEPESRDKEQASGERQPTDSTPIAAQTVANSLLTGRFERTLLVDDESDQPSAVSDQPSTLSTLDSQLSTPSAHSTLNPQHSTSGHADTVVAHLSDTLPGHSEHTSKHHSRTVYWQSIARIGLQAAEALQYAHDQGIIHRDVKPGNLLLDTRGSVWVTDFGLAKAADQQDLTHTGDVLGTLRYMAPEQFDGKADARSDVYALGLTLFELLALQPGFHEKDRHKLIKQVTSGAPPRLRTLDPHIPRDLETIIHKAIDRDPSHRYQTAGELAADLQRYLGDEPIRARWISPVTRFTRWCRRNPAVAGLTSTIAALLVIAAIVSSMTAVRFEILATEKANLASERGDLVASLNSALGDATSEQKRAQGNLDLALQALDAVYLDAIGEQKLLGQPVATRDQVGDAVPVPRTDLSDLEKELLARGLKFYAQFAERNGDSSDAAEQTARAYYRVALLQGALEERSAAEQAFRESINRYEVLIRNEPDNHRYHHELGQAYFGLATVQTNWSNAERTYTQADTAITTAIRIAPHIGKYYDTRGIVRIYLSDYLHAQQDAEMASELEPDNVAFHLTAAHRYIQGMFQHRDYQKATAHCERALQLEPDNAAAHFVFAKVLFSVDVTRALEQIAKAIELDPADAEAYSLRASILYWRRDFEAALSDANDAIRLGAGRIRRAQIYTAMGRFAEARADLDAEEARIPPGSYFNVDLFTTSARLALRVGDFARARDAYSRAIERSPVHYWYYMERAAARFHLGEYGESLVDMNTSFELNSTPQPLFIIPSHLIANCPDEGFRDDLLALAESKMPNCRASTCWFRYADLLCACERRDGAESAYEKAVELWLHERDHDAEEVGVYEEVGQRKLQNALHLYLYQFALLQMSQGKLADARQTCNRILEQFGDTDDPGVADVVAWSCALAPDLIPTFDISIELAKMAVSLHPESHQFRNTLAAILYRAGRHEEALEHLNAVAETQESDSSPAYTWYFQAMTHHALGNADEARNWLARANEWTERVLADEENPPPWNRKLTLELLRDEANSLIDPDDSDHMSETQSAPDLPPAPPATQRASDTEDK